MSAHQRPPEELRARLLAAAAERPATTPGTWRRRVLGYAVAGVGWVAVTTALLGLRRDFNQIPMADLVQTVVLLVGVAAAASAVGLARGRAMGGSSSETLLGAMFAFPMILVALVALLDPRGPQTVMFPEGAATWAHAGRCDLLVVVVGVPLVVCAWAVGRGLVLARPLLSGACVGLGAATWAHAVVRVHCAVGGPPHAIIAHLLPAVPLMLVGAWVFWAESRAGAGRAVSAPKPMR